MRTLFKISEDLTALAELLTDVDGDVSIEEQFDALEIWFDELGDERDQKIDNYCALIAEITARADARTAEMRRLSSLVATDRVAADRLKDRLQEFLTSQGIQKLKTSRYNLTVAANGGKAPLIIPESWRQNPAAAPERYHRRQITIDGESIRSDLEAGEYVAGCSLGERGQHLRIK